MLLFSSAKPKLTFVKLSEINEAALYQKRLEKVTQWFTEEWGYLHDTEKTPEQAFNDRKQYLSENADAINLVFYGKLMVGAFRVEAKKLVGKRLKASEIWFMYVDPLCRELWIGRQILEEIKRLSLAKDMPDDMVLLETLRFCLNRFYKQVGAKWVCENQIGSEPTDFLRIDIKSKTSLTTSVMI